MVHQKIKDKRHEQCECCNFCKTQLQMHIKSVMIKLDRNVCNILLDKKIPMHVDKGIFGKVNY